MEYTKEQLTNGVNYCKNKYVNGRQLYDILKYYDMPAFWYKQGKVECLDELKLFEDNDEYTNLDFKCDIEILIKTGSCYSLSVYIFELIAFIQNKL
jgi:hypothetical protein